MPVGDDLTRRGVLAAVGATALSGCSAIDRFGSDDRPTIDRYGLPSVDDEQTRPAVAPAVPVAIADDHLGAARDRTTALLSTLPTPLGPGEIPNGHVREHILDSAAEATAALDEARRARTQFAALEALRRSREAARYAAAGWAFAAGTQSTDALQDESWSAAQAARSYRSSYEYPGSDPVRATLVHARVERLLDRASDTESPGGHSESALLTAAETGETAESTQALLDDARHLRVRFDASLPTDTGSVEGRLRRAAETLLADLRDRRATLPPEPTVDDWGLTERTVDRLRSDAAHGTERLADAPGPASALVDGTERLAQFDTLGEVQARVDAGELPVESADDVRRYRQAARDALTAALTDDAASGLTRTVVVDAARYVWSADSELARLRDGYGGDISAERLADPVSRYVIAAELARAAPAASERTVRALESA
ncbi:hypothetical protein [Haloarcula marina]|uniref:hypothetical protein n=1 Tax=Haloarcula marina TaxID=2961574 RepID=UPI0020B83FAB|nr:hypothetical protein [Halomicroarcula marina]